MAHLIPSLETILAQFNINALNDMQQASLKANEKTGDVVLLSPTGSGKTLGFLLPVLNRLNPELKDIQALIIVPSRELAMQIEQVFKQMKTGFKVNCCYGGHSMETEENNLFQPPSVLIGTPGRLTDHINRRNINLKHVHTLVMDEFDKALEMGFQEDMSFIIEQLPQLKKRILTSATQSLKIPEFTGIQSPTRLNFLTDEENAGLTVKMVVCDEKEKHETLYKLICNIGNEATVVFCNHRDAVERICEYLTDNDIVCNNFHGGLEQRYRESTLTKFRNGSTNLLITTDLASRGLDIPEIKHIIHYQLPPKEDAFIHRNGRTARMDATGTSFLLLTTEDTLPDYIKTEPEVVVLSKSSRPALPEWETLFIGAGKKDKVNKIDVVGFLSKKGKLEKNELGLIEIKDMYSYAAVKRTKVKEVLSLVQNEKIKNQKVKIEIARETPRQQV